MTFATRYPIALGLLVVGAWSLFRTAASPDRGMALMAALLSLGWILPLDLKHLFWHGEIDARDRWVFRLVLALFLWLQFVVTMQVVSHHPPPTGISRAPAAAMPVAPAPAEASSSWLGKLKDRVLQRTAGELYELAEGAGELWRRAWSWLQSHGDSLLHRLVVALWLVAGLAAIAVVSAVGVGFWVVDCKTGLLLVEWAGLLVTMFLACWLRDDQLLYAPIGALAGVVALALATSWRSRLINGRLKLHPDFANVFFELVVDARLVPPVPASASGLSTRVVSADEFRAALQDASDRAGLGRLTEPHFEATFKSLEKSGVVERRGDRLTLPQVKQLTFGHVAGGLFCVLYLMAPTAGLLEFIPDTLPLIGNLDEALFVGYLVAGFWPRLMADWQWQRPFPGGDSTDEIPTPREAAELPASTAPSAPSHPDPVSRISAGTFLDGLMALRDGAYALFSRRDCLVWAMVPLVLNVALVVLLASMTGRTVSAMAADRGWSGGTWGWIGSGACLVGVCLLALVGSLLLIEPVCSLLGVLDHLVRACTADGRGGHLAVEPLGWGATVRRAIGVLAVGVLIQIPALTLAVFAGFSSWVIPPIGAVVGLISIGVSGLGLAWNLLDYPFGLAGLDVGQRLRWIWRHGIACLGLGIPLAGFSLLLQPLVLPLGVAAAAQLFVRMSAVPDPRRAAG